MLSFTQLEILDLFFRFAAVGGLLFIGLFWLDKTNISRLWVTRLLLLCLSGYLILTAPIENTAYGHVRGLVLFLTECLPYFLWLYVLLLIKPQTNLAKLHWFIKIAVMTWLLWFGYFFGFLQGRGSFHQFNHVLGILLYAHIVFMALFNLQDDLVDKRRKLRVGMAIFLGAYSTCLALLEIGDYSLRDATWFSLVNAATIFLLIFIFPVILAEPNQSASKMPLQVSDEHRSKENQEAMPASVKTDIAKLEQLMAQKVYLKTNLSIGQLATMLQLPEHRLRKLINRVLGFQNFSVFLNSYRIPAATNMFEDPNYDSLPILSIALELGFGSIGPFNRAFKQHTGITPSEYRKNFQNRA